MSQSLLTLDQAARQLPDRQKWDRRYAKLNPAARRIPTPFVAHCLAQLPPSGRALDVAAGAGRHTLALAQHGLAVDAIDLSWQGLRLARQRAIDAGLAESIRFIVTDVEKFGLPRCSYDVILVSYFLHRPLFPLIKAQLRSGGWVVYETFTLAQMNKAYHRRPSRRQFFLKPHELEQAFSDFDILFYDEGEHGERMTAQLLAQKSG